MLTVFEFRVWVFLALGFWVFGCMSVRDEDFRVYAHGWARLDCENCEPKRSCLGFSQNTLRGSEQLGNHILL